MCTSQKGAPCVDYLAMAGHPMPQDVHYVVITLLTLSCSYQLNGCRQVCSFLKQTSMCVYCITAYVGAAVFVSHNIMGAMLP